MASEEEKRRWKEYIDKGGVFSFQRWMEVGGPPEPLGHELTLDPESLDFAERGRLERRVQSQTEIEAGGIDLTGGVTNGQLGGGLKVPPFPTTPPPSGFEYVFDRDFNRWVPQRTRDEGFPSPISTTGGAGFFPKDLTLEEVKDIRLRSLKGEFSGEQLEEAKGIRGRALKGEFDTATQPRPQQPTQQVPTDAFGRKATWNSRLGQWDYPPNFGQRPQDQPPPTTPFQQQQFEEQQRQFQTGQEQFRESQAQEQQQFQAQLGFQQEQARQQAEVQRQQEMARLAANPINWLQFAAFTGEQPVVQPWMIPLGFQQFGQGGSATPQQGLAPQGQQPQQAFTQAGQQLQVGQPIPGLQGSDFSGLPQLRTPSAQLQARWGPTAQGQFLGFQRARTGASPEETQFRLGSQRAPAGRFPGFSRFR
ncbi:hypothetical protein LCGC14_0387640 [marine sediment metagenome]|uniref:Uncharacterized protein n=1 Tax=marine sediment metagenome TaxID=412755 RepID=A0A0F9TII1_9ZZZZ